MRVGMRVRWGQRRDRERGAHRELLPFLVLGPLAVGDLGEDALEEVDLRLRCGRLDAVDRLRRWRRTQGARYGLGEVRVRVRVRIRIRARVRACGDRATVSSE